MMSAIICFPNLYVIRLRLPLEGWFLIFEFPKLLKSVYESFTKDARVFRAFVMLLHLWLRSHVKVTLSLLSTLLRHPCTYTVVNYPTKVPTTLTERFQVIEVTTSLRKITAKCLQKKVGKQCGGKLLQNYNVQLVYLNLHNQ